MKRVCGILLAIAILLTVFPTALAEPATANAHIIPGVTANVSISWNSVAWQGNGRSYTYARTIYSRIWGYAFNDSCSATDNMLRNLPDASRRITAETVKKYIGQAPVGAAVAIAPNTSKASTLAAAPAEEETSAAAENEAAKAEEKENKTAAEDEQAREASINNAYYIIVVQKDESGFTYIENNNEPIRRNEVYVTWDGFASLMSGQFPYFRFIKYPQATPYADYAVSTVELRNVNYPATFRINTRNGWSLTGGLAVSNAELRSIDAKIVDGTGRVISGMNSPKPISGKVFAIKYLDGHNVDNGQRFSKITAAGTYKWVITVTDAGNRVAILEMPINAVASGNTVVATASSSGPVDPNPVTPVPANVTTLEFRDVTYPVNYNIGAGNYALSGGTLASTEELKTITTTIKKTDGTVISGPKTRNISGKAYAVKALDTTEADDNGVKFSRIVLAGDYIWTLTATDAANRTLTLEMPFTANFSATTSANKSAVYNNGVVPVSQITLNYNQLSAASLDFYGEYILLQAHVYPDTATNKAVVWSSSDEAVATVDKDGRVTLKGNGKATVTATAADGSGKSDSCEITVSIDPKSVTLNQTSMTLDVGQTGTLTATVEPKDAVNKNVIWSSDNLAVATVTDGVVTARAAGFATITARSALNGWFGQPEATCTVSVVDSLGVAIDAVNFPDINFREYVKQFDANHNERLEQAELAAVTAIEVSGRSIATLKGIEYFSKLQTLKCFSNNLTELDVSKNTELELLWCFNNKLVTLNTGSNVRMKELSFGNNQLTTVDLAKTPNLIVMDCESNKLSTLDITKNKALQQLWCHGNPMASLDISGCPHLVKLVASQNPVESSPGVYTWSKDKDINQYGYVLYINKTTALNQAGGVAINEINFPDANFRECVKAFDTDKNGTLSEDELKKANVVKVAFKQITNLKGIEYFEYLKVLDCSYNALTTLDLSRNPLLAELSCSNNKLQVLNLSGNPALTVLDCGTNQLVSLDVSRNTELNTLYCESNKFTQLDVSRNTKLARLITRYNNLTALDIRTCPDLVKLVTDASRETRAQDSTYSWNKDAVNEWHEINVFLYKYTLTIDQKTSLETGAADRIAAFVTRCYNIILGREPDAGGLQTWYNELNSGRKAAAEIINQFVSSAEFQGKNYSNADKVEILYQAMLGRASDATGKTGWVARLNAGQPLAAVINGFCDSAEFKAICASYGIRPGTVPGTDQPGTADEKIQAFVRRCYQIILGREPDASGMNTWFNELKSRRKAAAEIIDQFVCSTEFQGKRYSNAESVEILYQAMLGRGSDAAGKASWVAKLNAGQTLAAVINGFCGSAEFANICASYGITPGTVAVQPGTADEKIQAFVRRCYQIILGRDADATGMATWSSELKSRRKSAAEIIYQLTSNAEFLGKRYTNEEIVEILYQAMLGRGSDPAGKANWVARLNSGRNVAIVINGFCSSAEFKGICTSYGITPGSVKVLYLSGQSEEELSGLALNAPEPIVLRSEEKANRVSVINPSDTMDPNLGTAVQAVYINEEKAKEFVGRCYKHILGRDATQQELDKWVGQMTNATKTADQIARGFLFSDEFKGRNTASEDLVKIVYRVYMNREADPAGLASWKGKLDSGMSLRELLDALVKTKECKEVLSDLTK